MMPIPYLKHTSLLFSPLSHHVMREVRSLGSVAGRAPSCAGGGVALAGGTAAWRTGDAPGGRRGAHPAAGLRSRCRAIRSGPLLTPQRVKPEAVMDWAVGI